MHVQTTQNSFPGVVLNVSTAFITQLQVPHAYTIGSLLRFSKDASYWAFSVVGNWAERYRVFAHPDVKAQQDALEKPLFDAQVRYVCCAVIS